MARAFLLPVFLLTVLPLLGQAEPPKTKNMPVQIRGKHYNVSSTATKEQAQELLDFMEIVNRTYKVLLKPREPGRIAAKKYQLVLYRNESEYVASGAPGGSAAFYDGRRLVGWYHPKLMKPFFAHEGMHQFVDLTSKSYSVIPMWFQEGLADCFGNSEVRGGRLYMCLQGGAIARMRLRVVQRALKEGKAHPLSKLLTLSRKGFKDNPQLGYSQSWSFCHFLMCYPAHGPGAQQIPNGKYRKNLGQYYDTIRAGGGGHDRAWKAAFSKVSMDELEKQWKEYILSYETPKVLGVEGRGLTAKECKARGLPTAKGAVLVEKVRRGSAAEKGGIKTGDVVLRVDARNLPRRESFSALENSVAAWPAGKELEIVVLRGDPAEEVALTLTWPKAAK
ncbi:MAG: DUF1570 domain-containing protein [Planctomycetota bacterium]|jgi:hypothetical protein